MVLHEHKLATLSTGVALKGGDELIVVVELAVEVPVVREVNIVDMTAPRMLIKCF